MTDQNFTPSPRGSVLTLLRLEGAAIFLAASTAYFAIGAPIWLYAVLLFAPDLSFAGYALGRKAGAILYNLLHSLILPLALGLVGILATVPLMQEIALIWIAHIGLDRGLGYGLKYAAGFKYTHLGTLGGKGRS